MRASRLLYHKLFVLRKPKESVKQGLDANQLKLSSPVLLFAKQSHIGREDSEGCSLHRNANCILKSGHQFQHHWKTFIELMRRRPDLKIANNFLAGKILETAMHKRYRQRFEGRLGRILSSGVNGLWSKWHKFRSSPSGLKYYTAKPEVSNGQPGETISFDNSAIAWIFLAQSVCLLSAGVTFLAEIVSRSLAWTHQCSTLTLPFVKKVWFVLKYVAAVMATV